MVDNMDLLVAHPQISSVDDLHSLGQAFTRENGVRRLKYSWLAYVDAEDKAYFGHTQVGLRELSPQDAQDCLQRIPDEDIYPKAPSDISKFSGAVPSHLYVKRPDVKSWDDFGGEDYLALLLQGELDTLELLQKHPHANLARYHGALVRRGRITGIVLDQYSTTLKDAIEGPRKMTLDEQQRSTIMAGIVSAVEHLHTVGLAHNDLNPANVMLDAQSQPHLIDFGSCKPFGSRLVERGTHGWTENHSGLSDRRHDQVGLEKIRSWLEGKHRT